MKVLGVKSNEARSAVPLLKETTSKYRVQHRKQARQGGRAAVLPGNITLSAGL